MLPWICGFLRMCARTSATANSPIYRYIQCMYAYDIWIRGVIVRLCGWEWNAARITRYSQHNHKPTMSTQCVLCSSTRKHPQFSYRARAQSSALHLRTPPQPLFLYTVNTVRFACYGWWSYMCVCARWFHWISREWKFVRRAKNRATRSTCLRTVWILALDWTEWIYRAVNERGCFCFLLARQSKISSAHAVWQQPKKDIHVVFAQLASDNMHT